MTKPTTHRLHFAYVASVMLLGCGSGEQARVARDDAPADSLLRVAEDVNLCPYFEASLVLPPAIFPDETAVVAVRAVDPDAADSMLNYAWSASSGALSVAEGPLVRYSCKQPGPQLLTVVTRDAQACYTRLEVPVTCLQR